MYRLREVCIENRPMTGDRSGRIAPVFQHRSVFMSRMCVIFLLTSTFDVDIIYLTGEPEGKHYFPAPAKLDNYFGIAVDFLRVWTAIFYVYKSKLLQSIKQRLRLNSIPRMYSLAPPPTGSKRVQHVPRFPR